MMNEQSLHVREMIADDVEHFVRYWLEASPGYLQGMGVDVSKRPAAAQIEDLVYSQIGLPMRRKSAYFLTWLLDEQPVGCSHANQIRFGVHAHMHLHLWRSDSRQRGLGTAFVKQSLPFYFENLELDVLFCEPYSQNPAPNRTLEKAGFEFVKAYTTIPGASNFEQVVNQWRLTAEKQ